MSELLKAVEEMGTFEGHVKVAYNVALGAASALAPLGLMTTMELQKRRLVEEGREKLTPREKALTVAATSGVLGLGGANIRQMSSSGDPAWLRRAATAAGYGVPLIGAGAVAHHLAKGNDLMPERMAREARKDKLG